jgi:hypothetical protein
MISKSYRFLYRVVQRYNFGYQWGIETKQGRGPSPVFWLTGCLLVVYSVTYYCVASKLVQSIKHSF